MKLLLVIAQTLLLTTSLSFFAYAHDDAAKAPQAPAMPKDFEKLKALTGNWEATSKMGDKEDKSNVTYEVTAGGSAITEKMFAGTPHEMLTVYHADGGKVAMTHYCMLGNHPEMTLKKADDKTMVFEMAGTQGIGSKKETHMHGLTITVNDANHITEEWTMYENGKKTEIKTINLARK